MTQEKNETHDEYVERQTPFWKDRIQGLMGRTNVGFEVTNVIPDPHGPHLAYVLALDSRRGKFVTWVYNADSDGFASGHYFEPRHGGKDREALREEAHDDLLDRAGKK